LEPVSLLTIRTKFAPFFANEEGAEI
jgi:hypothetical protein